MPRRQPERIDGSFIDYLALGRGRVDGETIAMITTRLQPEDNLIVNNLMLTQEQALRLRDDLNFEFPEDEFPAEDRRFIDV